MRVFCRQLLVMVLAVLVLCSPISVHAVTSNRNQEQLEMSAQNDILFYDPNNCEDGENVSNQTCTEVSGDEITWIGDSYSVGAREIIEREFPGISFGGSVDDSSSYIQYCKRVSKGAGLCSWQPSNPSGFSVLQDIINEEELKPYLVFALGTNEGWSYDDVDEFKRMMSSHSDTKVIFVNSKIPSNNYTESNAILKSLVDSSSNYYLVDWASIAKDEYFEDDQDKIHPVSGGYQVWVDAIKNTIPKKCSAGLLPGDNNVELVWNYFVKANIAGVSNNPAAIAGIVGNMINEAIENPFCSSNGSGCNSGDTYHGIFGESDGTLKQDVDNAGLEQYWGKNPSEIPMSAIERAINIELDYLTQKKERWLGTGWASSIGFMNHLDVVDDTGSPESYADLFLVAVEGAYDHGGADALTDSGVQKLADSQGWTRPVWQHAAARRASAREVYDKYAGTGATPSGSTSGFSDTETLSGTANQKYDADDEEKGKLLRFALWEAEQIGANYKDVLSSVLDDFEEKNIDKKGDIDELMEFVESGPQFKYRGDYDLFATLSIERTLGSEEEQAAQNIINKGLRTTSTGQAKITSGKSKSATYCKDSDKKGRGAGRIAEVAALMSWPVQSWQAGKSEAPDYQSLREGKCYNGTDWVPYDGVNGSCRTVAREFYENNQIVTTKDCGMFVGAVLRYLGLLDESQTSWGNIGQPNAGTYFRARSDEWQELSQSMSEADLKPGDIMWQNNDVHGHIYIYIGEQYGGEFGTIAHASVPWSGNPSGRVGEIGSNYSDWPQAWYTFRYIGNKLGGGDCDGLQGGEAIACEAEYLAWPIAESTKADLGELTDEYKEAKDRWFGPNTNLDEGDENDVSCARFASLVILESGVDSGFARSPSAASRSNIRWLNGNENGDGMEGYLAHSSNWEKVTNGKPERGDIIVNNSPHVWIYLGGGLVAEGAGKTGVNQAGKVMNEVYTDYGSYKIYRSKG